MNKTYAEKLNFLYELDFADRPERIAERSAELLRWTLTSLLLGKPIEQGKEWLDKQLRQPPFENKPVANFFRFSNLAAVENLFGETGSQNLINAVDLLGQVEEESMFDTDAALVEEIATGLSMLSANLNETNIWREKRLAREVFEGWEASSFEILFSSSDSAISESLDNLAEAMARVAVKTLYDRNLNSVAPMVFAFAAHCAVREKSLFDILKEKIYSVDKTVFGDDNIPLLNFEKPFARGTLTDSKNSVIRITQKITGVGELSTGAYEIMPFTTGFVPIASKNLSKQKTCNSIENVAVEAVLILSDEIGFDDEQYKSLERRMFVAIEHSIQYLKLFDKKVIFKIKTNNR